MSFRKACQGLEIHFRAATTSCPSFFKVDARTSRETLSSSAIRICMTSVFCSTSSSFVKSQGGQGCGLRTPLLNASLGCEVHSFA